MDFAEVALEVVPIDIPILLPLDMFMKLRIVVKFDDRVMKLKFVRRILPIVRKLGHAYIERPSYTLYTEIELRRTHRHFLHFSSDRFTALRKQAVPNRDESHNYSTLQSIKAKSDVCQREVDMPLGFGVSMPSGECILNIVFVVRPT